MKSFRDKRTRKNFLGLGEGACVVVYDTETTGIDKVNSDIVQFAAKRYIVNENGIWEPDEFASELNMLIKPKKPIPLEVSMINHITNDMVKDAPTIEEAFDTIRYFMDADFWCGHNIIGFDNAFMERVYNEAGCDFPEGYYYSLDTLDAVVDLVDHKDCKKYNLGSMCDYFGIEESTEGTAGFHDALYDVRQCAELAQTVHKMYLESEEPSEGVINYTLEPTIYSMKEWKAYPKAYTSGNYFVVSTSCGRFLYDRYQQTWSRSGPSDVSIQKVIEAVYHKYNLRSDSDLLFWKPAPKEEPPTDIDYDVNPELWPLNFGKYSGKKLIDVMATSEGMDYLKYMLGTDWMNDVRRMKTKAIIQAALEKC